MKLDRNHFDTYTYDGKYYYTFAKVNDKVGSYISPYSIVLFELGTDEQIGCITESDTRASWKRYYTANYFYGWDGKAKTRKQHVKTLCTRGDYQTACNLMLNEYAQHREETTT